MVEKDLEKNLLEFLKKNPNPSDDKIHAWADKNGMDVEKVEAKLYEFATKFMYFWLGGKANKKGVTKKDVDPKQLKMGIQVEYEHTLDKGDISTEIAGRIALDHLAEGLDWKDTRYYTGLDDMERIYKQGKTKKASLSECVRAIAGYVKKKKQIDVGGQKAEVTLWYTKTPHGLKLVDQKEAGR